VRRPLLHVQIDDAIVANRVFTMQMGDVREPHREFMEANAMRAPNIDALDLRVGPSGAQRHRCELTKSLNNGFNKLLIGNDFHSPPPLLSSSPDNKDRLLSAKAGLV
jgi:hypothetical protein